MNRQLAVKKCLSFFLGSVLLPATFLLGACTPSAVPQLDGAEMKVVTVRQLKHHRWVLKTIDGEAVLANPVGGYGKGLVPELDFGEAQHVGGFAGCNQFSGKFEFNEQGQFRVDKMATTMMMCEEKAMQLEQRYAYLLSQWSDISINDNVLLLKQGDQLWSFYLFDWVQ